MSNEQVIRAFLTHREAHTTKRVIDGWASKGCTLTSTGKSLINYSTVIAEWAGDMIELNAKHYSVTTTKIQNKIRQLAEDYGITVLEVR